MSASKTPTIDDLQNAACIAMWAEWKRGEDCPLLLLTWDQIEPQVAEAWALVRLAEDDPGKIDGLDGSSAADFLEDARDYLNV